jgi:hydroxypyruvate reductase
MSDASEFLKSLFECAVAAVSPANRVAAHLPTPPPGRTVLVGAGKAAAAMARAVEQNWTGSLSGLVVVPYGHTVPCERIEIIEAAHPVPDDAGLSAAKRMIETASMLGPDDLMLAMISGGGSALLVQPAKGVTLDDKRRLTGALLRSGATISEINAVRRRLSAIKGGGLARAAHPACVVTLVISDVPGDDPAIVASGPTVAPPADAKDARAILDHYGIEAPEAIARLLGQPAAVASMDEKQAFARDEVTIIACAADALAAAADLAREKNILPEILGDAIEGEAGDIARAHAELAIRAAEDKKPCVLISGGETSVAMGGGQGGGTGGRNSEYLLALALALDGHPEIHAIACDTDGIDGASLAAGAIIAPSTLDRAQVLGLNPVVMLEAHNSGGFFEALEDQVITGPTRTNVNDFRAIMIGAGAGLIRDI